MIESMYPVKGMRRTEQALARVSGLGRSEQAKLPLDGPVSRLSNSRTYSACVTAVSTCQCTGQSTTLYSHSKASSWHVRLHLLLTHHDSNDGMT